nr:C2 calcium/lipid-binding domain, CaLB [Tanacetum cinerariifolium]
MDDDLFTYEVEIPGLSSIPCDKKEGDNSNDGDLDIYEPRVCYDENDRIYAEALIFVNKRLVRLMDVTVEQWLDLIYDDHKKVDVKKQWVTCGIDADMEYDPSDVEFTEWLASKFYNHMTMDRYTKNALWIYWTRGEDEAELTNKEFFDPDDENLIDTEEVADIFRIEIDIFDFETHISKAFNESNYLVKIDTDLLTSDILRFKTYDEFKNESMDEWNKGIPWVPEELWLKNGIPNDNIRYICEPRCFKNRKAKWPTCISNAMEENYKGCFEKATDLISSLGKKIAIQYSKPENPNELFQKLLGDLKELAQYENSQSRDRSNFLNNNEDHSDQNKESLENSSKEIATSNSNEEKEEPPQNSNIRQLIREECCVEASEEQKQSMEDTMLELVKICCQKELLCIYNNVDDLIESALNTKLLSINSQRLEKEKLEVKEVVEQPAERGNRTIESLQNFRVNHKSSISFKNTSQISSIHAVAPIISTKEPEYSMGYENPNTTPKTESDEIIKSGGEELVPILSENEVTSEDKRECDVPVCENSTICDDHSDFKNDDDISSDDDDFEDVEYVEASLFDPKIISVEEENVVQQEEEEIDLEDISQIQDVDLREKLLSITRLISNIKSLNDNPTPDCMINSSISIPTFEESDNSLSDNFSPEFKTFCDHTKETRSDNTTTHANDSLPEYDSFCFEIEPDQERLINVAKSNISDDSSNDSLLEEADLFLASDNSIPPGIENFADDSEGDIRFLEELLIDDSIPFPNNKSSYSNFKDNPSVPRPPPELPDDEFNARKEIPVVMNDKDEDVDIYPEMFPLLLSAESEDTIFDPGISD